MELPVARPDRADPRPLAVQLAGSLRAAAADGVLRPGDRLPSTRELAVGLGVSRTVTAAAYEQLTAEGWVVGRTGAGTFVVRAPRPHTAPLDDSTGGSTLRPPAPGARPDRHRSAGGARSARSAGTPPEGRRGAVDLRAGRPCVEVLDPAAWRRAWRAAADPPPDTDPDPTGWAPMRAAVEEHLLRPRGLAGPIGAAVGAAVLATAGSTAAIAELARTLPVGGRVAVEEPGYGRAVAALRAAGLTVLPVPVDGDGLRVDALPDGLCAVYCTPAHQFPLGARLSAPRRLSLVERARTEGFLVIEDDYDGELRYDVAPLPLLAALGPDVVAHLGTASKLLTPTLGVGWLVAPPAVRAAVLAHRDTIGARPARAGQRVLAALAAHGDLSRHLRRLRRELAARRALVVDGLPGVPVLGDAAGAHVVVPLDPVAVERRVLIAAAQQGVLLEGLSRTFSVTPAASVPTRAGIVLGYAAPPRAAVPAAVAVVRDVLRAESDARRR